jgi:hypothetical protein
MRQGLAGKVPGRAVSAVRLAVGLAVSLSLAGCGGGPEPVQNFPPLTYGYLRPLRLNVGTVDVVNDYAPGPNDVSGQSPADPVAALSEMARDRLIPAGASGRAVFTIEQASINRDGDTLSGLFRVKLDVYTSDGQRAAFAEAAVARTAPLPDDQGAASVRAALYQFTTTMMMNMNVELEYQLRRSIGDWLETGAATAPPPAPVEQQPLAAPDAAGTPPMPATGVTAPAPAPDGVTPAPGYRLVPSPPPAAP